MLQRLSSLVIFMLGLNCFSWAQIALPAYSRGVAKSSLVFDYDFSKTIPYEGSCTAATTNFKSGSSLYEKELTPTALQGKYTTEKSRYGL